MNYMKPEVSDLGVAVEVIEQIGQPKLNVQSDGPKTVNPAYDLDE